MAGHWEDRAVETAGLNDSCYFSDGLKQSKALIEIARSAVRTIQIDRLWKCIRSSNPVTPTIFPRNPIVVLDRGLVAWNHGYFTPDAEFKRRPVRWGFPDQYCRKLFPRLRFSWLKKRASR
jgi:hypothetical protein